MWCVGCGWCFVDGVFVGVGGRGRVGRYIGSIVERSEVVVVNSCRRVGCRE